MNLILAEPGEIAPDGLLVLRGDRLRHLRTVLGAGPGDRLRVGERDGRRGTGEVLVINDEAAQLRVTLSAEPPAPLPVTVVLALPRPKMLRRILRSIAELGVKELHLIHSYRVEKSYWQSPLLKPEVIGRYLRDGLEQAGDTRLPQIEAHRRFRPFTEDRLPEICAGRTALLADPTSPRPYPAAPPAPAVLIIGPEGGFIPFERDLIGSLGALPVHLGTRILRVETALTAALGRHLANPTESVGPGP